MIYGVEVSEQADSDLREIFEYIAFELQSMENEVRIGVIIKIAQ